MVAKTRHSCSKHKPCAGMAYALDRPDRRDRTGIEFMNAIDMEKGTFIPLGYAYRRTSKDNGIVFNYCPFCGTDYAKLWPGRRGALKKTSKSERKTAGTAPAVNSD